MGRRGRKKDFNVFLFLYIGVIVMYLVFKLFSWIASLSPIVWVCILLSILLLFMARRHFRLQRKQKEAELRKQELERLGNLSSLKKMTPIDFEYYISDLFAQMGFDAHVTKATGDGGKDILIYKKDFHAIIECKRYVKQKVTRPHVQKFHSAIIDCKADKGYIITTGDFTAQAISYAIGKSIVLIDGQRLIRIIEDITQESEQDAHADMILRLT